MAPLSLAYHPKILVPCASKKYVNNQIIRDLALSHRHNGDGKRKNSGQMQKIVSS